MSFSSDIKKELCSQAKEIPENRAAAMLYGIMYASRASADEAKIPIIQTENTDLINAAALLMRAVFPAVRFSITRLVKSGQNGSLFTLVPKSGYAEITRKFADFSSVNSAVVDGGDEESGMFLRGVFVCCGSVTDPNKEYHLELVLPENGRGKELLRFINEHGMAMKETCRARKDVIYAKESELIEDFLTYIGAASHSLEIMQVKIVKDFRNRVNRTVNCENANLDKTVVASAKSTQDIKYIMSALGADKLPAELRETARLRMENPELSLSELCGMLDPPISRSGLNHRLKRLSKIADELRESSRRT